MAPLNMPKVLHMARAATMSTVLIAPLIAAPVYAATTPPATQPQLTQKENVLNKASAFADSTSKTSRRVWTTLNTELSYSEATYEIRNKAMGVIRPVDKAMGGGLSWTDNTMSRPALLLMLTFIALLTLLGISSATARTGTHH